MLLVVSACQGPQREDEWFVEAFHANFDARASVRGASGRGSATATHRQVGIRVGQRFVFDDPEADPFEYGFSLAVERLDYPDRKLTLPLLGLSGMGSRGLGSVADGIAASAEYGMWFEVGLPQILALFSEEEEPDPFRDEEADGYLLGGGLSGGIGLQIESWRPSAGLLGRLRYASWRGDEPEVDETLWSANWAGYLGLEFAPRHAPILVRGRVLVGGMRGFYLSVGIAF